MSDLRLAAANGFTVARELSRFGRYEGAPALACNRTPGQSSCFMPMLGLKTLDSALDGVKLVRKGRNQSSAPLGQATRRSVARLGWTGQLA